MWEFLTLFAAGGFICGVAWIFSRRRVQHSWRWRAPFCFLIAAIVTPSAIKISESWTPIPAVYILPVIVSHAADERFSLVFGVFPIFAVTIALFVVWMFLLRKNGRSI